MEKYRQIRIKQIAVKFLKQKDYSIENLYAEYYKEDKYKQFRVTEKDLKQTLEEMISEELCERVEGHRNVFHYTAWNWDICDDGYLVFKFSCDIRFPVNKRKYKLRRV